MGVLIFFFFVICIAFPLGQIVRISPSLTTSFTLLDCIVGIGSALWLSKKLFERRFHLSTQAYAFLLTLAAFLLSLLTNAFSLPLNEVGIASLYIVRWVLYGVLFFMSASLSEKAKKTIRFFLLIGGIVLLLSGYAQFFFYPALRNLIYAGWDEHYYRMFGTFLDPNFFGLFLVCFFLFLLDSCVKQKKYRFFLTLIALLTFCGITLTYSRTAFIALGVGLLILFWHSIHWKKILVGFVLMLFIAISILMLVGRHSVGNDLLRSTSSIARLGNAKNALTIFLDDPIFGIGFNAYRYAQYKHHFMMPSPTQQDHGGSGADSSLLFILATSGVIGLSAFLFFLWTHIKILMKKRSRLGLAVLIAAILGSTFVDGLFYPSIMAWLWILLGVIESDGL